MKHYHQLLPWLMVASTPLAAQLDVCDYSRAFHDSTPDTSITPSFCLDTAYTKLASTLRDVYRRALVQTPDSHKRAWLMRSQAEFAHYLVAQESLMIEFTGETSAGASVRQIMMSMMRGRRFFLQSLLGEWTELDEIAARANMRADLRNLVTAEEAFFADSAKYTKTIGPGGLRYQPTPHDRILLLRLTANGWGATVGNDRTKTTCVIFVGATPIAPATAEGEPVCR